MSGRRARIPFERVSDELAQVAGHGLCGSRILINSTLVLHVLRDRIIFWSKCMVVDSLWGMLAVGSNEYLGWKSDGGMGGP